MSSLLLSGRYPYSLRNIVYDTINYWRGVFLLANGRLSGMYVTLFVFIVYVNYGIMHWIIFSYDLLYELRKK